MTARYIKYLYRKYRTAILFFLICDLAFTLLPLAGGSRDGCLGSLNVAAVYSCVMTYALPALLFAFVHDRRQSDVMFAMPVSRTGHLRAIFLFMLSATALFYLAAVAAAALAALALPAGAGLPAGKVAAAAGVALLAAAVLLLFNSLLCLLANNSFDGIVMMLAYSVFPAVMYLALYSAVSHCWAGYTLYIRNPLLSLCGRLSPVWVAGNAYQQALAPDLNRSISLASGVAELIVLLPVLCVLLGRFFAGRRAERAGQISDGKAAYPLVIRIYLAACMINAGVAFHESIVRHESLVYPILFLLLLLGAYVLATFVYRRRIVIAGRDLLYFAGAFAAACVLITAVYSSRCFGLADTYVPEGGSRTSYCYTARMQVEGEGETLTAEISFELNFANEDREQYSEAVSLLEELRRQDIDDYYSWNMDDRNAYLSLESCDYPEASARRSSETRFMLIYATSRQLTLDELKLISQYTTVHAGVAGAYYLQDGTYIDDEDYTLEELIGEYGEDRISLAG